MLSKRRKDDVQKSKRQRQSRQDDIYLDNMPIMVTASRTEFQNNPFSPVYQNVSGSTSYSQEIYGYPHYNSHGHSHSHSQWHYIQQYQFHQQIHHQVHQMPIIRPQPPQLPQQMALPRPIAPSIKTDPLQNMAPTQKIYTHDHNLPKDIQPSQIKVPMNNNASMQPVNISKTTPQQQNIPIRPMVSMQSNIHNLTNIPMHNHNHINISMQSPTNPIQSKLPDLQSQSQQYQFHNERSKSVVIKEVSAEALKKKIDKVSTSKLNDNQPLLNLQEPIVIISDDDEIEHEYHEEPQNGERKATEAKNISVTPTSKSSSTRLDSLKNKGKQVVQNSGQSSITPSKSTNNSPISPIQNVRNSNVSADKIREFIRLFDEIQMSKEDFGLRLIAITRLYHKLNSLNYDIEGHITLLAENDKLDHKLLKEFRDGINIR